MRRPRPHRLSGWVRRLLAAAVLGVLMAAVAVTAAPRPAAAAGLNFNVNLNGLDLANPLVGLPIPSLLPTPATAPATSPGLPSEGSIGNLCLPVCSSRGSASTGPTGSTSRAPGGTASGGSTAHSTPTSSSEFAGQADGFDSASATSTVGAPQAAGLVVTPPPQVDQLTPLAGISFGQAPYMWPLFLLLDVIAAAAVVLLVRRTWSASSRPD